MTDSLTLARAALLEPATLDERRIERVLGGLMKPGVDAADLYFQHSASESWLYEDGIVKTGSHHVEQGVGVRAIAGEKTGFAYSDEIALPALTEAAATANAIVRAGRQARLAAWAPQAIRWPACPPARSWRCCGAPTPRRARPTPP